MAISFNTILIPVDFSLNTEVAVKKAVSLAGSQVTILHLLHVLRPGKNAAHHFRQWTAEKGLEELKENIRTSHPGLRIVLHVLQGRSVQELIIECAEMLKPDLIIIGKQNSRRRWRVLPRLSPDAIARKSNYPVLTVKPGSAENRTRVIVIPIRDFLPERKLEWAVLLAKRYKAQIHLLAIHDRPETRDWALPQAFLKAYNHLREHLHHPIEYSTISLQSPARAALNYAESIMADMILVNPETESGVSGFTGWRHLSDLVGKDSKLQILDVEPYKVQATASIGK